MAMIASKCPHIQVAVVDINQERIDAWNSDNLPIYEPGLDEIVKESRNENLFFSTEVDRYIKESEVIFISVNTPTKEYGSGLGQAADLRFVEACARRIAEISTSPKIIVEKSTVPVRTAEMVQTILKSSSSEIPHQVISNPEFLAEGTAIPDLLNPDRVLIGGETTEVGKKAVQKVFEIYSNWVPEDRIITTNLWSSELSKLTANAFLAQRISSINAISALCEETGAHVDEVARAIGTDSRIGPKFLKSSIGFGGYCFQKDILNLVYIAKSLALNEVADYWHQVILMNNHQRNRFAKNIIQTLYSTVNGKTIAFLGWAFKKDTNDSRESAAIYVADLLIDEQANIKVYDPKVTATQMQSDLNYLKSRSEEENTKHLKTESNPYNAMEGAHAIAVLTEWDEFKSYDWQRIYKSMQKPAFIFDGRNVLDREALETIGFIYKGIGS